LHGQTLPGELWNVYPSPIDEKLLLGKYSKDWGASTPWDDVIYDVKANTFVQHLPNAGATAWLSNGSVMRITESGATCHAAGVNESAIAHAKIEGDLSRCVKLKRTTD
jgi:hypothetical protein